MASLESLVLLAISNVAAPMHAAVRVDAMILVCDLVIVVFINLYDILMVYELGCRGGRRGIELICKGILLLGVY